MKRSLSVLAGVISAVITIFIIEKIGHVLYKPAQTLDDTNPEAIERYLQSASVFALWIIVLAYFLGSVVAGLIATIVSKEGKADRALLAGAILMAFGLLDLFMIQHPIWMWVAILAVYLPGAWLGFLIGKQYLK